MINRFLQFLKKQRLAIRLAQAGSLFVISGLRTFRYERPLARLFRRHHPYPPLLRFQKFLATENNPLLNALYEEFSCRTDFLPFASYLLPGNEQKLQGDICFCNTNGCRDQEFYFNLLQEIVEKDYPELAEQVELFKKRADAIEDMRFYGSELEMLTADVNGFEKGSSFEVNWSKTNASELWLSFDKAYDFSARLPRKVQENLSKLVAYLIFEKSVFMSVFHGVAYTEQGKICLPDIDYLYPATPALQHFAIDCITHRKEPTTLAGYKMQRLLFLLQDYCPDIKVFESWQEYLVQDYHKFPTAVVKEQELLNLFSACGLDLCTRQPLIMTDPKKISWLLDSTRHKNDPKFKKSSILYWGPLFLLICFLLYYF